MALVIVGPAAWWCCGRYGAWMEPRTSRLDFFTGDNGPLRLSEDICSSKIVYCVGVRNEGTKTAGSVRVNIDSVEGYAPPTSEASLPIFRSPDNSASLQPGESEYFCVMRKMDGAGADDGNVAICCHGNPIKPSFSIQELVDGRTIALSVHSEGARGVTRQIQISSKREADATWSLDMRLLPDADEASARALEQRPVAARPPQVREAWNRVRAKLIQFRELSFGQRGEKRIARETSRANGSAPRTNRTYGNPRRAPRARGRGRRGPIARQRRHARCRRRRIACSIRTHSAVARTAGTRIGEQSLCSRLP